MPIPIQDDVWEAEVIEGFLHWLTTVPPDIRLCTAPTVGLMPENKKSRNVSPLFTKALVCAKLP